MSGKTMHDHSLAHDMGHDAHALASTGHDAHADAHGDPHADAHGHGSGHGDGHGDAHGGGHHGPPPISLAFWKLSHVQPYLVVTMFIILTGFAKMVFHKMHWLSSRIPESVLLIIVGAISGAIINTIDACEIQEECDDIRTFPRFTPSLFFYFLLPPIILESAFSLHNKVFMDNLRSIILYAVFGTICNFLMIGGLLILFYNIKWMGSSTVYKSEFTQRAIEPHHLNFTVPEENEFTSMTNIQILLFASLISAVDPVAVLAVFSEVGVNPDLYYMVFGESLLNDGVAVVLYNMMNAFAGLESTGAEVTGLHIITGIGSFFTVALGGLFVGFVFGLITAVVTKYTTDIVALEPLAVFSLAYLSYVFADLVNWSGIISLIGCGMLQAHYAFKNISEHGHTCIHVFIKMLAGLCDCIIFIYLGMALFGSHTWHTG
ncbi:Na(+)/H(+) exchanger protein 7 [Eurytemora carolleeae]|uniref:Na(+)/H(+) exchanger protein 7 n=1 Tax=Eurytemora carolleeae TaxID=1294199 RepID=UPI000C77BFBA|nr:Na(+)/H(+) exchanger protein 7 [Eurytemora carolleeae]|eukprot:XP_023342389.1 Na(+)/H(+) exchanger protein 7-like [Eurytemora affinis]